jgi:hypothetical protein
MQQITAYESIDKKVFSTAKEAMMNDLKIVLKRKIKNNFNLDSVINAMLEDNEITKMFAKYNDIIAPKPKNILNEENNPIKDILDKSKINPYIRTPQIYYDSNKR